MQPEVLAWALLFVVAFGLVYRFFAWLGRSYRRKSSGMDVSATAKAASAEAPAAPIASAAPSPPPRPVHVAPPQTAPIAAPPQTPVPRAKLDEPAVEIRKPEVSAAPPPPPRPVIAQPTVAPPEPPPSEPRATVAAPPAPPANTPRPAPASHYATPAPATSPAHNIGASSAVMSARAAAAAAATAMRPAPLRSAVAPSVAATLAPQPSNPPAPAPSSVTAVPSAPAEPPMAPSDANEPKSELPHAILAPVAPVVVSSAEPDASNDAPESVGPRPGVLRARRIGAEFPSLDIRIKDSQNRKILAMPRTSRKPSEPRGPKEMKVLAQKSLPERTPARRIGRRADDEQTLTSARAVTRIIGVPQRGSRIISIASV